MASKLLRESTLDTSAVQEHVAGLGRHANGDTVLRWINHGLRGRNGQRIRLEACRAGGKWLTSAQAISRFFDALTAAASA